jgi:hypothetical protein
MDQCSLEPEEKDERGREIRRIATAGLLARSRDAQTVRLTYRRSDSTEKALRDLIRRERECCPFLDFELRSSPDELTLEISAPPGGAAVLDAIYERSAPAPA